MFFVAESSNESTTPKQWRMIFPVQLPGDLSLLVLIHHHSRGEKNHCVLLTQTFRQVVHFHSG